MNVKRVSAAAAVVIAATAVVTLVVGREKGNTTVATNGNGNATCIGGDNSCVYAPPPTDLKESDTLTQALRMKTEGRVPQGNGPWPFVVTNDAGIGLKVRSTNVAEGTQLGGIAHLHTAWVTCQSRSGFDPEGNGDLWYQVKWDHQQPSEEFFQSQFNAKATGWSHGYYLTPYNHNGDVPIC